MYEYLLSADIVVADLSTSNANAIYELGVRHALRPYTTIVMCESNFKFPFDLSHLSMLKYEHLGKAIDLKEALRTRKQLKKMVMALADKEERDSPVYLCLPSLTRAVLQPPLKAGGSSSPGGGTPPPSAGGTTPRSPSGTGAAAGSARSTESLADLLEKFRAAKASARHASDWIKVVVYLELVRELQPDDAYVAQQLALATYKSEQPERVASLLRAKEILIPLSPETSSDAETVGLWGAIHKPDYPLHTSAMMTR